MSAATLIDIVRQSDIVHASCVARDLAALAGFDQSARYKVATAAAELASNILLHGGGGRLEVQLLEPDGGIALLAIDDGPGIFDVALAMREGYSSIGSLGCGLPGVMRMMDTVAIDSAPGKGTQVRACKWR
jgi:serine/threonine-protein kinase RsbT